MYEISLHPARRHLCLLPLYPTPHVTLVLIGWRLTCDPRGQCGELVPLVNIFMQMSKTIRGLFIVQIEWMKQKWIFTSKMVTRMWLAGVFVTLTISSTRQDKLRYPVEFALKRCKVWFFRQTGKLIAFMRYCTLRIMCQFFWHSVYFDAITSGEVPHPKLS